MRYEPTVFVVDDDPAVCASLELLLRSAGINSRSYPDGQSFLDDFSPNQPGCLIADIQMPGFSGLELQQRLIDAGIRLPLIFLTGHGDVPGAVQALKSGAVDFVEKPFEPDRLLALVHQAMARDAEIRAVAARQAGIVTRLESLTPREHQVMRRVVSGQANKVIAIDLDISERTVELHRARMMKKMQARSLADLVHMTQEFLPNDLAN